MTQPHKHADLLRAIADGKKIQCLGLSDERWFDADLYVLYVHGNTHKFRIAPETITVNGIEVPKPVDGKRDYANYKIRIECVTFKGPFSMLWFKSEADARAVYEALIAPFKGETE